LIVGDIFVNGKIFLGGLNIMPFKECVQNIGRAIGGAVRRGWEGIKKVGTTIGKHAVPFIQKVGKVAVPLVKRAADMFSSMGGIPGTIAKGVKGLIHTGEKFIERIPESEFKEKAKEIFNIDQNDVKKRAKPPEDSRSSRFLDGVSRGMDLTTLRQ
jgi:hypothetical protein